MFKVAELAKAKFFNEDSQKSLLAWFLFYLFYVGIAYGA